MARYGQLSGIIEANKPKRIVEIGTWTGDRAIQMVSEALKHQDRVHYTGFDLFEEASEETDTQELNVKKHVSESDVFTKLNNFRNQNPGFSFNLIPGNTRETLPDYDFIAPVDLAFIDGGHSIETIRSDFDHLKESGIIVLDDYYTGRDIEEFGCNNVLNGADYLVLPQKDPVLGGGFVQMVQIGGKPPKQLQRLSVKTKNSIPDEEIQKNVRYFLGKDIKLAPICGVHGETVIFVNGGPQFLEYLDEIKQYQADGIKVISVKHAYKKLLDNGIVPWALLLLDPRDHVIKYIEDPHPDVEYFVASQCHPSTLDYLIDKKVKIWGYHAHVGAGEDNVIKELSKPEDSYMFGGGSTSAMRGISVYHALGFRKFILYGFDCCYWPEEDRENLKVGYKGKPEYITVTVNDREFVTDTENIAQAQDFEKSMKQLTGAEFICRGDGMIPHIWKNLYQKKASFDEVFNW